MSDIRDIDEILEKQRKRAKLETSQTTPHALTMEQVITLESGGQGAVNVALRLCQTLTQQAQEIERLKVDLQERRTICRKATQAIIDAIGSDGPENIDHAVDRLIAKLAAMTAEVRRLQEELKRYKHD